MGFLISQTSAGSQNYKTAARAASSANVALSGVHPLLLGGVTLANKDRVLLKDQGDATENGLYVYTVSGGSYTLVRSADANTDKEVVPNMIVPVSEGTFADTLFQLVTDGPITLGITNLQFSFTVASYTDQDAIDAVLNNVELADFSDFYTTGIRSNVRYVNDGELDIQAAIDAVGTEQGKAIYLSPGSYGGATVTVTDKVNLRIIGPATASGSHLCELSGGRAMTISGATSTRVGLMNFEIEGGLTITGTQGRHYLRDMTLGGLVISGSTSNFLVFQNCSFTGPVSVNVPLGTLVYFIQCDFGNQTVTNTSVVPQQVIFNNCAGFNSLPTGTLLGQSVLAAGASQVNSDKVLVADGSAATPSFSFAADLNTGFFRPANDVLSISTNGLEALRISNSGIVVGASASGNVSSLRFQSNYNNTYIGNIIDNTTYNAIQIESYARSINLGVTPYNGFCDVNVPLGVFTVSCPSATTNTVSNLLRVRSESAGTPATGIGVGIEMLAETSVDNFETGVLLEAVTTEVTPTNESFDFVIKTMASGSPALERVRVSANALELSSGLVLNSLHNQGPTVAVLPSDCYIGCNSGAIVNLPSAALCKPGQKLIIKDESGAATTNNISINANGSDLIDGNASESLVVNYESITLICNGVDEWFII